MNVKIVRNIAHDLKGPIGNTLMFSELLRDQLKNMSGQESEIDNELSSLQDLAENVHKINEKLITLVDSWSEIYKILQGDVKPERKKLEVGDIVEELRERNELYFNKKDITCIWAVPEKLTFYSDHDMLLRILDNLLTVSVTNVDYDAKIEFCVENLSDGSIQFTVSDQQMGDRKQLYEHYLEHWSIDKFSEEKLGESIIKASGVGLVYCSVAVDALDGTKGVTEKDDGMAEVWFKLPDRE